MMFCFVFGRTCDPTCPHSINLRKGRRTVTSWQREHATATLCLQNRSLFLALLVYALR